MYIYHANTHTLSLSHTNTLSHQMRSRRLPTRDAVIVCATVKDPSLSKAAHDIADKLISEMQQRFWGWRIVPEDTAPSGGKPGGSKEKEGSVFSRLGRASLSRRSSGRTFTFDTNASKASGSSAASSPPTPNLTGAAHTVANLRGFKLQVVCKARQSPILIRQYSRMRRHRPIDGNRRIIMRNAVIMRWRVVRIGFVNHFRIVLERTKAVRKAPRDEQLCTAVCT